MFARDTFLAPPRYETKLPWGPVAVLSLSFLVVAAAFFLGQSLFRLGLFGWVNVTQAKTADEWTVTGYVPLQKILLATNIFGAILLLAVAGRWRVNPLDALALRRPQGGFKAVAAVAVVFLVYWMLRIAEAYIRPLWGGSPGAGPEFVDAILREGWLLALVSSAIAAPVAEELLFRGFLLPGLAKTRLGFWGAAWATSIAFALVHVQQYGLANVGWIAFTGLMFAWALRRTGSLWAPIALHVAINTVGVTAMLMRL